MKQAWIGVITLAGSLTIAAAGPRTFTVDTGRSKALIDVGKTGAFSFAGHTHEVEAPLTDGTVHFDPDDTSKSTLHLEVNAAGMKVTGKSDPPADVPKVTEAMLGEQVLNVKQYPSIHSTARPFPDADRHPRSTCRSRATSPFEGPRSRRERRRR